MSVETFLADYKHESKPLKVPPIMREAAKTMRLAPGGNAEVEIRTVRGKLVLEHIASAETGKGHGSASLAWLCDLADRHKVTLVLNVVGDRIFTGALRLINQRHNEPNLNPARLRAWYRRHGFVTYRRAKTNDDHGESKTYDVLMRRNPR